MSTFLPENTTTSRGAAQLTPASSTAVGGVTDADVALMQRTLGTAALRPNQIPDAFMGYILDYIQSNNLVIPISQVVGYQNTVNNKFLGSFAQSAWPPAAPTTGNLAELKDTNNSAAWLAEYRDDLNVSLPWRPYNGDTSASGTWNYGVDGSTGPSINRATQTALGSFVAPVAGSWEVDGYLDVGVAAGAAMTDLYLSLGTTSTATDILNMHATGSASPMGLVKKSQAVTFTKGQTVYVSCQYVGGNATAYPFAVVAFRPVNLANA